jgi:heme A synthase
MQKRASFARYAWFVLAFNLAVILWGAYVRASGSGAGCGSHWPMCNGEVIPRAKSVATLIEFTHRLTSGLSLILVVGLAVAARRLWPQGAPVRRAAGFSLLFIVTEALIGAGLVLFELVAHDASMKRALSMCLHLTNTFILLACLVLTALWSSGFPTPRRGAHGPVAMILAPALTAALLLGTSGAVAALGDTLFPSASLAEGFAADLSPAAHAFVRLRVWHPVIAIGTGVYLVMAAGAVRVLRPIRSVRLWSRVLVGLFVGQFALGVLNMVLLAPTAMQLAHLFTADLVWMALVALTSAALAFDTEAQTQEPSRAEEGNLGALPVALGVGGAREDVG